MTSGLSRHAPWVGLLADDMVRPFQLERSALRGRLVRLGAMVDRVLTRHDYPEPVGRLLGELFVLCATMAGELKFDGTFSIQIQSDGPVSLMVADCTNDGAMRGYAKFDAAKVAAATSHDVAGLLGHGLLALTVDQSQRAQTYQGVVELCGEQLTDCMQAYFRQSEQLKTGIRIALERVPSPGERRPWRAGGIMVQRLPEQAAAASDPEQMEEDWRRTMLLLATVSDAELTDPALSADRLLLRLFHEEGVRVFGAQELTFRCRCSRERVEALLRRFPEGELDDMRMDDGGVLVTCQFCNEGFRFDEAQIARLQSHGPH